MEHCFHLHVLRTSAGQIAHPLLTAVYLSLTALYIAEVSVLTTDSYCAPSELLYTAILADIIDLDMMDKQSTLIFPNYLGLMFDAVNREIQNTTHFTQVTTKFV